jgi:hypothetical protein
MSCGPQETKSRFKGMDPRRDRVGLPQANHTVTVTLPNFHQGVKR